MRQTLLAVVLVTVAVASSGCGTVCNLFTKDPEVYGGVAFDLKFIASPRDTPLSTSSGSNGQGAVLLLALIPAELCLSFVGDTLTLPLTIHLRQSDASALDIASSVGSTPPTNGASLGTPIPLDETVPAAPPGVEPHDAEAR
jgi:uncharacterized protein YceK